MIETKGVKIEDISKFVQDFDTKQLDPETIPSIIARGGTRQIELKKLDPKDIQRILWLHPVMPRGIEMKANRMVRRGYTVSPSTKESLAKEASDYCNQIIENSGAEVFLGRWIQDAYGFGNGFWTLVPNKLNNEILKLNPEHPVFFGPAVFIDEKAAAHGSDENKLRMKVDPKTKEISAFTQFKYKDVSRSEREPFGKEIKANMVAHLMFNRYGDEAIGTSLVQYIHLTVKYVLNLEEAGAERMWRDGFTQKKVTTEITNDRDLKKLAKNIANINVRDTIILPKGTDVVNLTPGTSDFPRFHDIYMKLLAIRLGLPQPLLLQDGTSTNKATIDEMRKDILADFAMDELIVEQTVVNHIFKPALELKFGKNFPHIPIFKFNELPEDEDEKVERFLKTSEGISNISSAIKNLSEAGVSIEDDRVISLLNYLTNSVADAETLTPKGLEVEIEGKEDSKTVKRAEVTDDNPKEDKPTKDPEREDKKEGDSKQS